MAIPMSLLTFNQKEFIQNKTNMISCVPVFLAYGSKHAISL